MFQLDALVIITEYLQNVICFCAFHNCRSDFGKMVVKEYLSFFEFEKLSLLESLRQFLLCFSLTGESQERERIMIHFSDRYFECNPDAFTSVGELEGGRKGEREGEGRRKREREGEEREREGEGEREREREREREGREGEGERERGKGREGERERDR